MNGLRKNAYLTVAEPSVSQDGRVWAEKRSRDTTWVIVEIESNNAHQATGCPYQNHQRNRHLPPFKRIPAICLAALITTSAHAQTFDKCVRGQKRSASETCVVDGDTIWLDGVKIRLEGFDTPEPQTAICGGRAEIELAHRASDRLVDLLNENVWTIEYFGTDSTQEKRRLATISIDGRDVGDILIDEGLARKWPDGREWWCR